MLGKAIYNSKEFWRLRKDMLDGKLEEYCEGCTLCNAGYENLKKARIYLDDYFYL